MKSLGQVNLCSDVMLYTCIQNYFYASSSKLLEPVKQACTGLLDNQQKFTAAHLDVGSGKLGCGARSNSMPASSRARSADSTLNIKCPQCVARSTHIKSLRLTRREAVLGEPPQGPSTDAVFVHSYCRTQQTKRCLVFLLRSTPMAQATLISKSFYRSCFCAACTRKNKYIS